ncbi:helix-hairpin-helix domain-containing protein [Aquimarina gracilis]
MLLFSSVILFYFYPNPRTEEKSFVELTSFQKEVDSLKKIAHKETKIFKIKPFNPNFISDYKGYQLGLSPQELDRLNIYRNEGKWINSVTQFKQVTMVSDSLLSTISPLFRFPDWTTQNKRRKRFNKTYTIKTYSEKQDLNLVTQEQILEKVKVPDFIAQRIINYRNKIGGFIDDIQLQDVSGLYENQRKKLLSFFTVKTPQRIEKQNINNASVNQLIEVPYIDFEVALEIRDYIKNNGSISNFKELGKIKGFSLDKIDRIALYLTLN